MQILRMSSRVVNMQGIIFSYRSVLIRYLAISEGAALFSLIAFYLTGDHRLFLMTGIMLAAMLWAAPTTERIIATLNPDWQEQQDLR